LSLCSKSIATFGSTQLSAGSGEHGGARHKTGHYNAIAVFVKFIETENLTLSRDDLLELKLVRFFLVYITCVAG